jgi:hypothetical protein
LRLAAHVEPEIMRRGDAHIVYCEQRMLLDKGPYGQWRETQDAYADYKASLGSWTEAEIVAFLLDDWGHDESKWPFSRESIAAFFLSDERVLCERIA